MNKKPGANLEFVREDDYVEYYIFPQIVIAATHDDAEDDVADEEAEVRAQLLALQEDCMQLVQAKIAERGYIWHKDEFQLQARTGSEQERLLNEELKAADALSPPLPPHLHGVTHFGDNISDEWFVVYLLNELTRANKNCIGRICDADGEFLLIEAADALPNWANPDTCEQRVYIVAGSMQLVQNSPANTSKRMSVALAVEKIRQNPTLYRVAPEIQTCIDARMKEFVPAQQHASIHRQIVQVPLCAAALLKEKPALIAAAVRAFCERDTLDAKALRTMRFFPPETQQVRTNVAFTRCLYAMLMHSQYTPERKIGWQLTGEKNTKLYKEQILGIKIASGLEILAAQAKGAGDFEDTPAWRGYLRSLQDKGYFRNELAGSVLHQRLLLDAQEYYKANQQRFRTAPLVGADILALLHAGVDNAAQMRDEQNNLQPSDSDAWLHISAEELDAMLLERYGPKQLYKSNGDIDAAEFTKHLSDFLGKESNFEGIECELDSDDDSDVEAVAEAEPAATGGKRQAFREKVKKNHSMRKACKQNPLLDKQRANRKSAGGGGSGAAGDGEEEENASTHVRNFLDFVIPEDNWDSTSEMSDYEDEHDMEHHLDGMSAGGAGGFSLDKDIKEYMAQMDRELANTTMSRSFHTTKAPNAHENEDDFDDIESFEPININVNTLKNMLDSYKSQIGGAGPATNLFSAMGVGMSAAATETESTKDLSESTV